LKPLVVNKLRQFTNRIYTKIAIVIVTRIIIIKWEFIIANIKFNNVMIIERLIRKKFNMEII